MIDPRATIGLVRASMAPRRGSSRKGAFVARFILPFWSDGTTAQDVDRFVDEGSDELRKKRRRYRGRMA